MGQGCVADECKSSTLASLVSQQKCIRGDTAAGDAKLQSMDDKLSKVVHDTKELKDTLGASIAAELMFKLRDMLAIHEAAFKVGEGSKGEKIMKLECARQEVPDVCGSEVAAFEAVGSNICPDAHQVTEEQEMNVSAVPQLAFASEVAETKASAEELMQVPVKLCQEAGTRSESTSEGLGTMAVEAVQAPAQPSIAACVAGIGLLSKRRDLTDLAASITAAADAAAAAEHARLSMKRALADAQEGAAAANLWQRSSGGVWRRSSGGP